MTRELFVSSTPHETKVGMVEDDLLAEIYLERENEYTLAGSIYKGRVTRVLPGMQSAFVDIGLERDAFLYVSDFMELEEHDDDLTEVVPTNRPPVQESRPPQPRAEMASPQPAEGASYVIESEPFTEETTEDASAEPISAEPGDSDSQPRDRGGDRGSWRGRRRRRGRRGERDDRYERNDRNQRAPNEARFSRSAAADATSAPSTPTRSRTPDYGPPPGYQPIILPGESISKYQRLAQQPSASATNALETSASPVHSAPIVNGFPGDEPLFATGLTEPLHEQHGDFDQHEEATHQEWEREHALQDRMNLRATFTEQQSGEDAVAEETDHTSREPETRSIVAASPAPERIAASDPPAAYASSAGAVQAEEIIEEEEADLTSYVEDLEEDATFEELEEETSAAEDYHPTHTLEIAATGEPPAHAAREEREHIATGGAVPATPVEAFAGEAETEEEAEEEGEEAEIEDAQAEAEALLEAEARGNSTVDARVEVRAPAGTAGYT